MSRAFGALLFAVVLVGLGIGWVISNPGQLSFDRASAAAIGDDNLRSILQARYDSMQAAMVARDPAILGSILAPNFTCIDTNGRSETGPEMISRALALKKDPNSVATTTLVAISAQADKAIVQERYDLRTNRRVGHGKHHNIEVVALSIDTWVKSGETWLIERSVTNEITGYDNGKLISHQ